GPRVSLELSKTSKHGLFFLVGMYRAHTFFNPCARPYAIAIASIVSSIWRPITLQLKMKSTMWSVSCCTSVLKRPVKPESPNLSDTRNAKSLRPSPEVHVDNSALVIFLVLKFSWLVLLKSWVTLARLASCKDSTITCVCRVLSHSSSDPTVLLSCER